MIQIMMCYTMPLISLLPSFFSSDVEKQTLLPPIALGFAAVLNIDYDSKQKRLLVYGMLPQNKGNALMAYSTNGGPGGILSLIPEYKSVISGYVDSDNQIYYVIGSNSTTQVNIGSIDLNNPDNLLTNYQIKCNFTIPYYFELNSLYYDPDSKNLIATIATFVPALAYWLAIIPSNGQGSCTAYPMKTSMFGIATCFSYDQITKTLWFGFAPNGPSRLISYDLNKMKITNEFVFSDSVVLEDLQVTYF